MATEHVVIELPMKLDYVGTTDFMIRKINDKYLALRGRPNVFIKFVSFVQKRGE